jgi:hypothetical protein
LICAPLWQWFDLCNDKSLGFTLKAAANSSPGFALKPWVENESLDARNSERVASVFVARRATQLFQSCIFETESMFPGLPERNPGLAFANAFSVSLQTSVFSQR